MTPERLAELRRRLEHERAWPAGHRLDPDTLLALIDVVEAHRRTEQSLRAELTKAENRARQAERKVALLREELEDVTAGWFDPAGQAECSGGAARPLLRAIEGGAGS